VVTTTGGSCSLSYSYVVSPANAPAPGQPVVCGNDFFYPSPATGPVGNFAYCMAEIGTVRIRVYNAVGDIVARIDDVKPAGAALSPLNTARLAPGVYLYILDKNYGNGNSSRSHTERFVVRH